MMFLDRIDFSPRDLLTLRGVEVTTWRPVFGHMMSSPDRDSRIRMVINRIF